MVQSLGIFDAHPRGYANPVIFRASAVLPAHPNWDAGPTEYFCANVQFVYLVHTYTRGADGGAFDFRLEASLYTTSDGVPAGASEWACESIFAAGVLVTGADTQSFAQCSYVTYGSTSASTKAFAYGPIALRGCLARLRIGARESLDGVPATPGTLQITGVMV